MFGLFHLPRRAFVRCAALVFFSFASLNLWEGYHFELADPTLAALQVCVLFIKSWSGWRCMPAMCKLRVCACASAGLPCRHIRIRCAG